MQSTELDNLQRDAIVDALDWYSMKREEKEMPWSFKTTRLRDALFVLKNASKITVEHTS